MAKQPQISIIEDDGALCEAIAGLLRCVGYEAHGFASAEAFLAWEGADDCDCVITDIHLPGMSGIELKQSLVGRQSLVPVIMITAHFDVGAESRALSSGAVCLLEKPFSAEALISCLSKSIAAPAHLPPR